MDDTQDGNSFLDFMIDPVEIIKDERHPAIKQIERYYGSIFNLTKIAETLVVEDEEASRKALDISAEAKTIYKTIEDYRKKAIEPSRRIIQAINECAKNLQQTLNMIEGTIKVKLAGYQKSRELKEEEIKKSIQEMSASLGIDISIVAPPLAKNMSSSKAATYMKHKMSFVVVDEKLIPDEYWIVDEGMIQKHIDLGKKEIPGIKIVIEKELKIRRK